MAAIQNYKKNELPTATNHSVGKAWKSKIDYACAVVVRWRKLMFQSDVNGESGRIFVKFDSNNQWKIPVGMY